MKNRWIKGTIYAVIILTGTTVCFLVWADHEINKVLGSSTKAIGIAGIINETEVTQITNTNVLSEDCTHFIKNQDVVIKEGQIISMGNNKLTANGTTVVDGKDKFLIPGLIDSHVHLKESKNDLFLYLVNGVTFIREMAGRPITLEWRKSIKKTGLGPKMFIASPPIYSESGLKGYFYSWTRQSVNYSSKEQAKKEIEKIKALGYDAIKMYGFVPAEMFSTTVEVAKANNIMVIGHIPAVNLQTFYQSGQKEVAHIEELTQKNMEDFGKSVSKNPVEYLNFLSENSAQIAENLKRAGIGVTSTVWLSESFLEQRFHLSNKLKDIELRYVNPKIIEGTPLYKLGWLPGKNGYEYDGADKPEARKLSMVFWETYVKAVQMLTKVLVDHQVMVMAGTDANVATSVPGFSLHQELAALTKSGMTNAQALYSATVAPSIWMKTNTGKIKTGYASDLVLLTKNPLEDINNTKTVEYVFFGKKMIGEGQIGTILRAIELVNNKNRQIKIDKYLNNK